jgi:tetratricopeptide (TPR) repeat protein
MSNSYFDRSIAVVGWLILMISIFKSPAQASEAVPIQVKFANSCSAEVQSEFRHAVTLLHSFEYPETERIFNEIIDQDPSCAMARWGAAMSIWHPLWAPPSKSDLQQGARTLAETTGLETTPREAAYIGALKAFFSSDDINTHRNRSLAYEARMSEVYEGNLDDPEAAVFYALAVRTTADPRDKSYTQQFKAAAILNWVRSAQPTHPGVLHYLIHSYDSPGLAHLALDVANTYADAAPDSAHAQHMPSHIFTRLGLWESSLSSNHDSTRSAAEFTVRAKLPGHYDEGLHSMDYLMYAMLQTARDDEAQELLIRLGNIKKTDTENFKVAYTYAASPARYALERRKWDEASELQFVRKDFDWNEFGWAQSIHYFARGIGAARSGQSEKARQELTVIKDLQQALPPTTLPYWREEVQVQADAVMSWILLSEGKKEEALDLASAAADREDAVDKHPVTPGEVLPARELYADMLFEMGEYANSLTEYRIVLKGSPNRLNALLGAAAAATRLKDLKLAEHFYEVVREYTQSGNRMRSGLAPAWKPSP